MILVVLLVVLSLVGVAEAADRQIRLCGHPDIAHVRNGKVVAVTATSPFGNKTVSLEEVRPKIAIYIRDQTTSQPKRTILRVWRKIAP